MKITYDEAEMLTLVKRVMPKEFIPEGWSLISVTLEGYSYDRRFVITIEEKKEQTETPIGGVVSREGGQNKGEENGMSRL